MFVMGIPVVAMVGLDRQSADRSLKENDAIQSLFKVLAWTSKISGNIE